jgi:predicted ATP-dependent endonuclease of OLD family
MIEEIKSLGMKLQPDINVILCRKHYHGLAILRELYFTCDHNAKLISERNYSICEHLPSSDSDVILIDQIEMYMHVIEQRVIVDQLIETYQGTQFIVTTMSPFIIQSLRSWDCLIKTYNGPPRAFQS